VAAHPQGLGVHGKAVARLRAQRDTDPRRPFAGAQERSHRIEALDPNQDFLDLIAELQKTGASFLVIGAYALAAHGIVRATEDLDILVRPDPENARRVWRALAEFGAPMEATGLTLVDLERPDLVFQIGQPPRRIDILTEISGIGFDEAWKTHRVSALGDLRVPFIGRDALVRNKRASGRSKDLADLELLEGKDVPPDQE